MKATGIVRRIDDLGRIVIPKEIRRTVGIKEGDPLEIFLDNGIVLKKYEPYETKDWYKAKKIVQALTTVPFSIYESFGDIKARADMGSPVNYTSQEGAIYMNGEIVAFIRFNNDKELVINKEIILKILGEFFSNEI